MMPQSSDNTNDKNLIAITVGEGKTKPQGSYLKIECTVQAVAEALRTQPATVERWWSMHLWKGNKRAGDAWMASSGISCDIDYRKPENPPEELVVRLRAAAASGELPGAIFHTTPHGARLVWVYERPNSDRALQIKAERGAHALVGKALETLALVDYEVDLATVGELARFYYTPNSIAKGVKRQAEVFVMNEALTNPVDLSVFDVSKPEEEKPPTNGHTNGHTPISNEMEEAIVAWNTKNTPKWPKNSAPCPICGDSASFGELPSDPSRWYCFSTDHTSIGLRGNQGFHGDALDLEAFKRNLKPIDVLRADGYLRKPGAKPNGHTNGQPTNGHTNGQKSREELIFRALRSRSYLTAVQIIRDGNNPDRKVLEGSALEFNEMHGVIELARKPIKDSDRSRIRSRIELLYSGGVDKQQNEVGLQLSPGDVGDAIEQVAHEHPYHPVRSYLSDLKWDGQVRLPKLAQMIGAEDVEINHILIRRFFLSAVARPLNPGCKVDTVFILVGPQGAKKSSFFDTLAAPWFIDTPIDISHDPVRAYMTMRKGWINEWAELESLLKAKRHTTIKAFLSSRVDDYVPKHARYSVNVPRSGIVVGSTNTMEFLEDETGERRYWPVQITDIDLVAIAKDRDQLWAEAVHFYQQQERWWLSKEEEDLLAPRHHEHRVLDAWDTRVAEFAAGRGWRGFTTADVLAEAIRKEIGSWTRADEMRIAKILKSYGCTRRTDPQNVHKKVWCQ